VPLDVAVLIPSVSTVEGVVKGSVAANKIALIDSVYEVLWLAARIATRDPAGIAIGMSKQIPPKLVLAGAPTSTFGTITVSEPAAPMPMSSIADCVALRVYALLDITRMPPTAAGADATTCTHDVFVFAVAPGLTLVAA
jgi:hypothetical protein